MIQPDCKQYQLIPERQISMVDIRTARTGSSAEELRYPELICYIDVLE
jgi:hypothetical protein